MKQFPKTFLTTVIPFVVVGGIGWLLYWLVKSLFLYLAVIPKELGAALVAGTFTVVAATSTVMVGRHFERKKELDTLFRDKKTEIYDEFLRKFFDLFFSGAQSHPTPEPEDLVSFLREFSRKLILWSGPEPIAAFLAWKDHLAKGVPDAQTIFLTERFLFALRSDLRQNNTGIPKGFFAGLILKESSLFLSLAEKNPRVTLAEVAEAERILSESSRG